jgi:hypothetical protein
MAKPKPNEPAARPTRNTRPGVRGPGGPPAQVRGVPAPGTRTPRPAAGPPAAVRERSARRVRFEERSAPLLAAFARAPKWAVVVGMALLLFAGLVMPAPLGWLGAILLVIVASFLGWLLALSWPILGFAARVLRVIVVAALLGIAVLKAMGRF